MNELEQTAVYPQLPHVQAAEQKKRLKKIREPSRELLLEQFRNHAARFDQAYKQKLFELGEDELCSEAKIKYDQILG